MNHLGGSGPFQLVFVPFSWKNVGEVSVGIGSGNELVVPCWFSSFQVESRFLSDGRNRLESVVTVEKLVCVKDFQFSECWDGLLVVEERSQGIFNCGSFL